MSSTEPITTPIANSASQVNPSIGVFPADLMCKPFADVDKKYLYLYLILFGVVGGILLVASFFTIKPELTQQEALQIKKRYAQLEIAKPEVPQVKKEEGAGEKPKEAPKTAAPSKAASSSGEQREERRAEGQASRSEVREALREQIASQGLFAELTAAGDDGEGEAIDNILGRSKAPSLGNIKISSGSFSRAPSSEDVPRERRGERIAVGGLGEQRIEKANVDQIEVSAAVELARPSDIEGGGPKGSSRSVEAIQDVILKIQDKIKLQFEKYLRQDPTLSGKVEVEFTILADGSVTGTTIVRSSLGHDAFERRLLALIERLRFAPATSDVKIIYPFVFSPSKV